MDRQNDGWIERMFDGQKECLMDRSTLPEVQPSSTLETVFDDEEDDDEEDDDEETMDGEVREEAEA